MQPASRSVVAAMTVFHDRVAWLAVVCVLAVSTTGAAARGDVTESDRARAVGPMQEDAAMFLPFLVTGRRGIDPPGPATREVLAMTATAAASGTSAARTPTRVEPTVTPTIGQTVTPDASPTASASATRISPTPTPTSAQGETATPTRTAGPEDPFGERLRPAAALRSGTTRVTFDAQRRVIRLTYSGGIEIAYEIDLTHPDYARGRLTIREATSGRYPVAGAGLYYRRLDGVLVEPWLMGRLGQVDAVDHAMVPDGVAITVHETLEGAAHRRRFTVRLEGRALEILAESLDPAGPALGAYAGFSAGDIAGTGDVVTVRLPYMDAVPVAMLDDRWFASTLVDYPRSGATQFTPRGPESLPNGFVHEIASLYLADTDGTVRPVSETVWVTLSPAIADVFPIPSADASLHRAAAAARVHVMLEGSAPRSTFGTEAAYLDRLADYGVTEIVAHKRFWSDPAALPPAIGDPDPSAGGEEGWARLVEANGLLAAAQAYSTTLPGCPSAPNARYRAGDTVRDGAGAQKGLADEGEDAARCPDGSAVVRYLLAPDAALRVAVDDGEASSVTADAVHLGDLAAWNPGYAWPGADENVLDRGAASQHPATAGQAIATYKRLFAGLQEAVGPLYADGAHGLWHVGYDSFYAGHVDGVWRSPATGSPDPGSGSFLVAPDYELQVVRSRTVGIGMGQYDRWLDPDMLVRLPLSDAAIDRARALTLVFGHTGAWIHGGAPGGADWLSPAEEVKEYHVMRALQRHTLDSAAATVTYFVPDGEGDLSWALARGLDLSAPRLRVAFDDMTLWVNLGVAPWRVGEGEGHELPQAGWLAQGTGGLLAYSATVDGRRVDALSAPDVALVDGRGQSFTAAGLTGRDLVVALPDGRRIEEMPDGSLRVTP